MAPLLSCLGWLFPFCSMKYGHQSVVKFATTSMTFSHIQCSLMGHALQYVTLILA